MSQLKQVKYKFSPISFWISLFGLLFSIWNVLNFTESFCFTPASCLLFSEFAVLGFSFWWLGVLFFTMTLILALFGFTYWGSVLGRVGVFLDTILLFIMFYTMPCVSCLLIGLTIAAVYFAFCYEGRKKTQPLPKPLLLLPWAIIFIMVCGNIMMSYARPWAIVGNKEDSIHVYFSMECTACETLIDAQGNGEGISWYPVQEKDDDIWKVGFLVKEMENGTPFRDAYKKMREATHAIEISDIFSWSHWDFQFALWKNAAYVMKGGQQKLPFVEFQGLPSLLLDDKVKKNKGQQKGQKKLNKSAPKPNPSPSKKSVGKATNKPANKPVDKAASKQNQIPDQVSGKISGQKMNDTRTNYAKQGTIDSLLGNVSAVCGDEAEPCPE